jgi:hypothetical protein
MVLNLVLLLIDGSCVASIGCVMEGLIGSDAVIELDKKVFNKALKHRNFKQHKFLIGHSPEYLDQLEAAAAGFNEKQKHELMYVALKNINAFKHKLKNNPNIILLGRTEDFQMAGDQNIYKLDPRATRGYLYVYADGVAVDGKGSGAFQDPDFLIKYSNEARADNVIITSNYDAPGGRDGRYDHAGQKKIDPKLGGN